MKQLAKIERAFGDLPLAALGDPLVSKVFLDWRDGMASSLRQADYAWTVLMRLMAWARSRGLTTYRPPGRIKRLYHCDRSDKIWEDQHIAAFMAVSALHLQWALVMAADTGQRQGDLLRLPWSAYDGKWITLTQSKTGRKVRVPVTARLRAVLSTVPRIGPTFSPMCAGDLGHLMHSGRRGEPQLTRLVLTACIFTISGARR